MWFVLTTPLSSAATRMIFIAISDRHYFAYAGLSTIKQRIATFNGTSVKSSYITIFLLGEVAAATPIREEQQQRTFLLLVFVSASAALSRPVRGTLLLPTRSNYIVAVMCSWTIGGRPGQDALPRHSAVIITCVKTLSIKIRRMMNTRTCPKLEKHAGRVGNNRKDCGRRGARLFRHIFDVSVITLGFTDRYHGRMRSRSGICKNVNYWSFHCKRNARIKSLVSDMSKICTQNFNPDNCFCNKYLSQRCSKSKV